MGTHEIRHRVGIAATPEKLFAALTDPKQLERWWSEGARGESRVGDVIQFRFSDFIQPLKVAGLEPSKRVHWTAGEDGAPYWEGTEIEFRLERDEEKGQTLVYFRHSGFKEPDMMFSKSSMKWAVHLLSLKALLETGRGTPYPHEIACDHD
jgi:uncharacterized protein YndB with AHSA1/START domain